MASRLALLALLALTWAPLGAGAGRVDVWAPPEVHGLLGQPVTLPCHLRSLEPGVVVTMVSWTRRESRGNESTVAVFHPTQGASFSDPARMQFVAADERDASLKVLDLRVKDEADYSCQFTTFPMGIGNVETRLHVLAQPQNSAEAQWVPLSPPTGEPVPVARCVSSRGRPPAQITWSPQLNGTSTQSLVSESTAGAFTVTSILKLVPSSQADGQEVTCVVEHESLEEKALLPVTLSVRYPPEVSISGYDDNWYLGRAEATLTCDVRSNPEPTGYDWSTITGPLPPSVVAQGAQLLIPTVDKSINTTFICRVTNALGTSQDEVTVQVRDQPIREQSGISKEGILGVILGVLIFLVLLGVLTYCWFFKHPGWTHPRPSANRDVDYSVLSGQVSSSPVCANKVPVGTASGLSRETGAGVVKGLDGWTAPSG